MKRAAVILRGEPCPGGAGLMPVRVWALFVAVGSEKDLSSTESKTLHESARLLSHTGISGSKSV